ncbi:hypothetical protein GCM10009634_50190 [Saccharothrix xinjiangensis]
MTDSSGRTTGTRTAATGSQKAIMTSSHPANMAMSWWTGCTGRSMSDENWPDTIRAENPYGVKATTMFRTSIQTRKYAESAPAVHPPTEPPPARAAACQSAR